MWVGSTAQRFTAKKPENYTDAKWEVDKTWIQVAYEDDTLATLRIDAAAPPGTATVKVTVTPGEMSATATINVVAAPTGSQDFINAKYSWVAPAVGIVNGVLQGNAGNCTTTVFAFVRHSVLADMASPCGGERSGWEAVVFDTGYRAAFISAGWMPGTNSLDAQPAQGPPLEIPIALRIMVFDPDAADLAAVRREKMAAALDEIKSANSLLSRNRAGIRISEKPDTMTVPVSDVVSFTTCAEGEHQTSTYDVNWVLHVYYVDDLGGTKKGSSCVANGTRPRDVIYVVPDVNSPTTLIHELGHTLGLTLPSQGHTDVMGGFDATNVMHSGDEQQDPAGRHRLSIGQVFRMNADSASWLNRGRDAQGHSLRPASNSPLDCQCSVGGPHRRCPPMQSDLADPSQATPATWMDSWACYDQIQFSSLTDSYEERPVVLLGGRSWRALPGECSKGVFSQSEGRLGSIYGKFVNLTHPSNCPSWAAVFFTRHRTMYLKPQDFELSQTSNKLMTGTLPPAPPVVWVRVYYPLGAAKAVSEDRSHARGVFGESNRVGIDLVFDLHLGACPASKPTPVYEVILCYKGGVGPEATSRGRRIEVLLGSRKPSTVAHYIGRALGLKPLPSTMSGFANNIMSADPNKRGQKLTLGQVFRLQVPLSTALPKCDPGPCPTLGADVP